MNGVVSAGYGGRRGGGGGGREWGNEMGEWESPADGECERHQVLGRTCTFVPYERRGMRGVPKGLACTAGRETVYAPWRTGDQGVGVYPGAHVAVSVPRPW